MAVTADVGGGDEKDEEWCTRGCEFHWRISVDTGSVIIFTFSSSCGQAYISEDEADAIGNALKECARVTRENRDNKWKPLTIQGFSLEHHDPGTSRR
jgi:hypothetical protein